MQIDLNFLGTYDYKMRYESNFYVSVLFETDKNGLYQHKYFMPLTDIMKILFFFVTCVPQLLETVK